MIHMLPLQLCIVQSDNPSVNVQRLQPSHRGKVENHVEPIFVIKVILVAELHTVALFKQGARHQQITRQVDIHYFLPRSAVRHHQTGLLIRQ